MGAKCCAGGTADDAKKLDAAIEKNDIKSVIRLLSSTQPIAEFDGTLPWADPKTVGALAATQLAIMSRNAFDALNTSNATKVNDDIRKAATKVNDDIRKAGAIPPLVNLLESREKDRRQCAIVALAELTRCSAENSKAVGSAGGIGALMKHKNSPFPEARRVAMIVRSIFWQTYDYRDQFVETGGVSFFIKQLNAAGDSEPEARVDAIHNLTLLMDVDGAGEINEDIVDQVQLDAIHNLTLLMDGAGEINEDIVDQLKKAGIDAKLQGMEDTDHDGLKEAIGELRDMLRGKAHVSKLPGREWKPRSSLPMPIQHIHYNSDATQRRVRNSTRTSVPNVCMQRSTGRHDVHLRRFLP